MSDTKKDTKKASGLAGLIQRGGKSVTPIIIDGRKDRAPKEKLFSLTVKVNAKTYASLKELGMKNRLNGNVGLAKSQGIINEAIRIYFDRLIDDEKP